MNTRRFARWLPLVTLGLLLAVVLGRVIHVEVGKARLYSAGQEAAAAGRWPEAFHSLRALAESDPDYRDTRARLAEAVEQVIASVPGGSDVAAETELLRWLAATSDPRQAEVLDRCVVVIPAGEFLRGSDGGHADEQPQQAVYLDAYAIDRYEVTNVQYQRFVQASGRPVPPYWSGSTYPPGQGDSPVVGMSWLDADAYCTWAGKRLPTEAEWEKACRGVAGQIYPWGGTWDPRRANVDLTIDQARATPRSTAWEEAWPLLRVTPLRGTPGLRQVGSYPDGASPYRVMDLVGNASEWVADVYNWSGYWDLPTRNPLGVGPPVNHVLRGSSWYEPYGAAGRVEDMSRCSARNSSHIAHDARLGFRCARSLP